MYTKADIEKLAEDFVNCQKVLVALGNENRQHLILEMMKMEDCFGARACLKIHSRQPHAPLCGIFAPYSVAVARYSALMRNKSPTNCDARLT